MALYISIHALLAESDTPYFSQAARLLRFLSTLSLRRATIPARAKSRLIFYFYPRSPCGERQVFSTLSALSTDISIHALLAESDRNGGRSWMYVLYFYPRSPCGERPILKVYGYGDNKFLSTLSLRRATQAGSAGCLRSSISIHALLAESDPMNSETVWVIIVFLSTLSLRRATRRPLRNGHHPRNFYPRSPCGERLSNCKLCNLLINISIHALLAESDIQNAEAVSKYMIFLSTLSLRRATPVK